MDSGKVKVRTAAIVLAAGKGRRMGGDVRKQFLLLDGKPILYYSLKSFEDSAVDDIILVSGEDDLAYCRKEIVEKFGFKKVMAVIPGGRERYHSVYEGLKAVGSLWNDGIRSNNFRSGNPRHENSGGGYVLIHDGARPFIDGRIIRDAVNAAVKYQACVIGMPVKDTIKIADEDGFARMTPRRADTWVVQTPQAFSYPLIWEAYEKLLTREEYQENITDDAMVVETMTACRVKLVEGSYKNMKVTTPEDMDVANAFLRR